MNDAAIWWKYIPSARRFRKKVTGFLSEDSSVHIIVPKEFPYLEEFTDEVVSKTLDCFSDRSSRRCKSDMEAEEWIKNNFYSEEERLYLNPRISIANSIVENENTIFHSMVIVISSDNEQTIKDWLQFISSYFHGREGKKKAVFLIISQKKGMAVQNMRMLDYMDYADSYDFQAFASLLSADLKMGDRFKSYLTELACLCGKKNAEKIAYFINEAIYFLKDPISVCVSEYGMDKKEMESLVWKAQIRTVYPIIEDFRQILIRKRRKDLEHLLPVANAFGETIAKPEDLEIGTLSYLVDNYQLNLPYDMIRVYRTFRESRNKLSHISILSYDEICTLLEWKYEMR